MQPTELGLTFGQILALVTVIGAIISGWINISVRVKAIEVEVENVKKQRASDIALSEINRKENRQEHNEIMNKLDDLIQHQFRNNHRRTPKNEDN